MKSALTDLNNHLYAQLERLGDEDLKGEELEKELKRTAAITDVSKQVISNAQLVLDAHVKRSEFINMNQSLPPMLSVTSDD